MSIEHIRSRAERIRAAGNEIRTLYGVDVESLEGQDIKDAMTVLSDIALVNMSGVVPIKR